MIRLRNAAILRDTARKMVFLTGPRQVGKTWLAKELLAQTSKGTYLNYDRLEDRRIIQKEAWLPSSELIVFDELHKMPKWKAFLKGVFDTKPAQTRILVTGSARLDTFRQGGDSLAGRFFGHHLMPFTFAELARLRAMGAEVPFPPERETDLLAGRGGFPEPLLAPDEREARRWRQAYVDGLIREDILDFERILDLRAIRLVLDLLRKRVGSTVSYRSLSEDVAVAPATVKKYVTILEALHIVFRVSPWSRHIARSLLKEPKLYFYDTGLVDGDTGAVHENLAAVSLQAHTLARRDLEGIDAELHFLRTKDGLECDFCLVEGGEVREILEVKYQDDTPSKPLKKFQAMTGAPARQLVWELRRERTEGPIRVESALNYCRALEA
ncbi:MAG: ATP-binding protein [Spirochaetes bacterium]|nr:ATP-binding protein [Spirochaetota bacterium]